MQLRLTSATTLAGTTISRLRSARTIRAPSIIGLPKACLLEGRRASSTFDVQYYLATYADLQAAFGAGGYSTAFDHWLIYGIAEGRNGAP